MECRKDSFKKRLAALLLTQANKAYRHSKVPGVETVGEITASNEYSGRCMEWWDEKYEPKDK